MRPNFSCFFKFIDLMKQIHDEYAGLGIRSVALRSFTQNRSYKRVTVSDSLSPLFKKEWPWADCSRSLQKRDSEWIALVAFYKRATVSKWLSNSLKRVMSVICFSFEPIALKKWARYARKKRIFCMFFQIFPPFHACQRVNRSRRSSLRHSFLKSDSLFFF